MEQNKKTLLFILHSATRSVEDTNLETVKHRYMKK